LLLGEGDDPSVECFPASEQGDVRTELCFARGRKLSLSVEASGADAERQLAVAHYALPEGLPGRFGPEVAERLLRALGESRAPRRLGLLVATTLGAQGRTPLPRALLPQTCYLAALAVVHGRAQALTVAARTGAVTAEASAQAGAPGTKLTFCTGPRGAVDLDVEARGLGLTWQLFVFQAGPARQESP
jgi:hypothetical protein